MVRAYPANPITLHDGRSLAVIEAGAGAPIIFVHGLPGLARDFLPIMNLLSTDYRCIAYDRAGYGASSGAGDMAAMGVDAAAADLLQLMQQLQIEAAHLVGWSYGGPIALRAAHTAPDRVKSLILLGAAGPSFKWPGSPMDYLLFRTPLMGPVLRFLVTFLPAALRPSFDLAFGARAPQNTFEDFIAGLRAPGVLSYWLREGRIWEPSGGRHLECHQPSLVMHGDADRRVPLSVAQDNAAFLARSQLCVIEGAGHWPFATHTEMVACAIRGFLESLGSE